MNAPASSQLVYPLLLVISFKATIVLITAWLVSQLARRSSASLRHHIWMLAVAAVLMLPVLQMLLPSWQAAPNTTASQLWRATLLKTGFAPPSGSSEMAVSAVTEPQFAITWTASVVAIWIAGAGLMLFRIHRQLARLKQLRLHAKPPTDARFTSESSHHRHARILIASETDTMPCTWGFLQPRILLPPSALSWPTIRTDMVLAHEFAHIRRFDWPVQMLAETARAFFWFHPLIWLAVSRLRETSECACDDAVLASGQNAARYADELLDLLRTASNFPAAVLTVARRSNFERRFTAMLNPNVNRRRLTRTAAISTTTHALFCLVSLASVQAPGQELASQFTGTILDAQGTAISNATILMTNTQTHEIKMTGTDAAGAYEFNALPAGDYELRVLREGFQDYFMTQSLTSGIPVPHR